MEHLCPNCGSALAPGAPKERSAVSGAYTVTVRGLPELVCPRGCSASRHEMTIPVFSLLGLATQIGSSVAKSRGFFRKTPACRACGRELIRLGGECRWVYSTDPGPSGPLEIAIAGPGLRCTACQRDFIPEDVDIHQLSQALSGTF